MLTYLECQELYQRILEKYDATRESVEADYWDAARTTIEVVLEICEKEELLDD